MLVFPFFTFIAKNNPLHAHSGRQTGAERTGNTGGLKPAPFKLIDVCRVLKFHCSGPATPFRVEKEESLPRMMRPCAVCIFPLNPLSKKKTVSKILEVYDIAGTIDGVIHYKGL